ncbi:uncharacterized protein LOC128256356 [Drosophila gunungcola]|uniref:uncharacterized protein LOC128256356 n=1 Tax=Drosophila gunungcola TaxID=103775 RepID=UPI0022E117C2|nr:uncharacterized protein LOC128256356 [Drosophila gunungcola]
MIVRPILTYGALAWGKRAKLISMQNQLGKLQRLACVCMTGAMRTCPTAALEVLMELTPLHYVIDIQRKATLLRISTEGTGSGCILNSRDATNLLGEVPLILHPRDEMTAELIFEQNFTAHLGNKKDWTTLSEVHPMAKHTIAWYTDGSLTQQGTGLGVVGPRIKYHESLGQYTSIFQAEVCAIGRCAELNIQRGYKEKDISILSDSRAAITALHSNKITSKLVLEVKSKLNILGSRNRLALRWIPGHKDISGNELADKMAKLGAEQPLVGPEPYCGIGRHTIKEYLRKAEGAMRQEHWRNTPGLRQAKTQINNYNKKRFKELIQLGKNSLRIVTGLLTGHCRLKSHLGKMGITSSGTCRFCDIEDETSRHIIADCPALASIRCKILGTRTLTPELLVRINPLKLLDFIRGSGLISEL